MSVDCVYAYNVGLYGDRGWCGCTQGRRRLMLVVLALMFACFGIAAFVQGTLNGTPGGALLGVAAVWLLCAVMCPNGCCGMYAANRSWGMLTRRDVEDWFRMRAPAPEEGLLRGGDVESGHSKESEDDEASRVNAATLVAYFTLYNSGGSDEATLASFVAAHYAEDYESHTSTRVFHKGDLPGVFRQAWAEGRKLTAIEVSTWKTHATYAYTMTFASGAKPVRINANATFASPGVLRRVTFTVVSQ